MYVCFPVYREVVGMEEVEMEEEEGEGEERDWLQSQDSSCS